MDTNSILHKASHLKWVMFIGAMYYMVQAFIHIPDSVLSLTSNAVFLLGIYLGLDSLSDVSKLSQKQLMKLNSEKAMLTQSRIILMSIYILLIVSTFFIFLQLLFPKINPEVGAEIQNLGLNCLALMLGFLCLFKSVKDKYNYAKQKAEAKDN